MFEKKEVVVVPEKEEDIPRSDSLEMQGTPLDILEDMVEEELSGSDREGYMSAIPETPLETPLATPLATPSHTLRGEQLANEELQNAISYIDDVLGDL